jgi:TetR/AcrR family transcriptional regulator, cholesterol catabolism regulator
MKYTDFLKILSDFKEEFNRESLFENRDKIRVKKDSSVAKNLERIFDATLVISNKKGFQAMTMRDLSREAGLSMGALYSYFSSKEDLLTMLQNHGRSITKSILEKQILLEKEPSDKLRTAIKIHLYLSEAMQPWFYFSYMEARNLSEQEQTKAIESELYTEKIFEEILKEGGDLGVFLAQNHQLTAGIIKAMLQDWYLKRWKYAKRNISVQRYAEYLINIIEAFCLSSKDAKTEKIRGENGLY